MARPGRRSKARFAVSPHVVLVTAADGLKVLDAHGAGLAEYSLSPTFSALLVRFASGATLEEALATFRAEDRKELCGVFAELRRAALLVDAEDVAASPWTALDRVFHAQVDCPDAGHVAVTARREVGRPLGRRGRATVLLPAPAASDTRTFRDVLQARRSCRAFGRRPMHMRELGTFLHGSLAPVGGKGPSPTSTRGLDTHVVCYRVDGVAPGSYVYDPSRNTLDWGTELAAPGRRLLARTCRGMRAKGRPSALIITVARFGNVLPAFSRVGYHLLLRDAGAMLQTFYLVATSLGLAPCAMGAWETSRLDRWLGLDGHQEGVVGVFALGTQPNLESRGGR